MRHKKPLIRVELTLRGLYGNTPYLLGAFADAAKRQGFGQSDIDAVLAEAESGDYDHLLRTLIEHTY